MNASGALEDLVREASRHQLRVLVMLPAQLSKAPQAEVVRTVHGWLGLGIAGLWVPKEPGVSGEAQNTDDANYLSLVSAIRASLRSFPGDRLLITNSLSTPLTLTPRPSRAARRIDPESFHAGKSSLLTTRVTPPLGEAGLSQARFALSSAGEEVDTGPDTLMRFSSPPASGSPLALADATLLLGSKGAVMLDFGQEIGLATYPGDSSAASANLPVMQWTPSNHTTSPAAADQPGASAPATEPQFGTYHPYVPPPRGFQTPSAPAVRVVPDRNIPDALPAPDSLAGFTSGVLSTAPLDGSKLNVTTEDRDPKSLLNAYRQLIAIHHGNATVRNGTQYVLSRNSGQMLVWVRRAPSGSRTVANVIGALNLSASEATVSVDSELEAQGMRSGALRPLFSSNTEATTGETTEHLRLPPYGALLGEIYHGGRLAEPAPRVRHGERHSRHRIRR